MVKYSGEVWDDPDKADGHDPKAGNQQEQAESASRNAEDAAQQLLQQHNRSTGCRCIGAALYSSRMRDQ